MIQLLASRYQKHIAYSLAIVFYLGIFIPIYGMRKGTAEMNTWYSPAYHYKEPQRPASFFNRSAEKKMTEVPVFMDNEAIRKKAIEIAADKPDIDGPSQPEMSSFKSVGTTNMVNLFTGDFNYNISLLDVGGYPVNIFYDGGTSMEQEASWVGLGWNINPGNVNRNMRGVPDDFNGEEQLIQEQAMKPNKTWGVRGGADFEFVGIKDLLTINLGVDLGVSFNNYLGPSLELGIKGGVNIVVAGKSLTEKSAADTFSFLKVGASVGGNINSRYGFTLSPNVSFTASSFKNNQRLNSGLTLSTSYNSRNGIKELQISDQMYLGKQEKDKVGNFYLSNASQLSTSISFAKPSYIPAIRMPVTNTAGSGHFQIGSGDWGAFASGEVEAYAQKSEIAPEDRMQKKPMVGYLYYDKAANNRNAVMDFTRVNDKEVTPKTPVISAPQYVYDVFTIQGEGTGGSIRAYRNDMGYVRDNYTVSKDKSWGAGVDIGIPGHYGGNFNTVKTPSTIGEWGTGNKLRNTTGFRSSAGNMESVYFRNPGESSVLSPNQFDSIGGTDMVRYKIGGTGALPTVEPVLQRFTPSGSLINEIQVQKALGTADRKKRTQVVSFLTAEEASKIGLDTMIKSYDPVNFLDGANKLQYDTIGRCSEYRMKHHISQINVTEADGKRYVYGIPVYNIKQKDFSFTVSGTDQEQDVVPFSAAEASTNSSHVTTNTGKDGFVQITTTPPYAHSFLLSGLLSPDYVDVKNDGITEDDLGTAVKFNYTRVKQNGAWANHKWRTPLTGGMDANFNPGNRSETKDDKGLVSYGERESWYLHSIESKTMIAFFTLEDREDGKGSVDSISGINTNDNSLKRLKKIDLYSKADLKKNGIAGAKPIKSVRFEYSYRLCGDLAWNSGRSVDKDGNVIPNNTFNVNAAKGKLTLEKIYFTYNGQDRINKNQYVFSYGATDPNHPYKTVAADNPSYQLNASDRWGSYKPASANPGPGMKNAEYPYTLQNKPVTDQYAASWSLKKILLPSGGQIEVEYESDDYAFVQNKRAAAMSSIIGFSNTTSNPTSNLYNVAGSSIIENDYVFIKVPDACNSKTEVYQKYLQGVSQLAFKLAVQMPKNNQIEYLASYATIADYDVYSGAGVPAIWIKLNKVSGYSPLSLTAIEYLREQLPGQAFSPAYDLSESSGFQQLADMIKGWGFALKTAFADFPQYLRSKGKAQVVDVNKSFVRLNDPDGYKYGGGQRVKSVKLKDNWKKMTHPNDPNQGYTSVYGQEYNYTTTEVFNGAVRTISSGVASYEPSIGGEENPFQTIIQVANELPLGPTSYGAIEMPVLDAFFPAPLVGYSKVTVRSINKNPDPANKKTRSGAGKQVTEFYTAKDFPVYYNYTSFDPTVDKQEHKNSLKAFFYKYAFDSRALSQGFIVATNDMHGKVKSQSSYAANDSTVRINYTQNFYRNTGTNGLNEKFDFVYASEGGVVRGGNMGIDIELMTDVREFSVKSSSFELQVQLDKILPFPPFFLPFPWPVSGNSENTYRAVTTTKSISYHSVLDSIVVIDKGSEVSTKNLVYDAETGNVIVSRTNNEFDKPVYSVNYPAYWAYSGMGQAYKNIDAVYSTVNFLDGKIVSANVPDSVIESGDELYIIDPGTVPAGCGEKLVSSASIRQLWIFDKYKNNQSLTTTTHDYVFLDKDGKLYTRNGVMFRIVRSGKRNMLGLAVGGITLMADPVIPVAATRKLIINSDSKVILASAEEYNEKWQADNTVFRKTSLVTPPSSSGNLLTNGDFTAGNTGFTTQYTYNPSSGASSGVYNISTNSTLWDPNVFGITDHTTGAGNMMMVTGHTTAGKIVWSQTVSVTPNTNYSFFGWANIHFYIPAQLKFTINGVQIGNLYSMVSVVGEWKRFYNTWNSGPGTTATVAIIDNNTSAAGNDFALDDLVFKLDECYVTPPQPVEVEDCNGSLEANINPYRKGLVGCFRSLRNMQFYGDRIGAAVTAPTNLPQNGFLNNFQYYWNFNSSNNLVPDLNNPKWVWVSRSTRFNSKSMELETMDALGIYTSAQYGFNETTPVAIANNARYDEIANESFEDNNYNESLNGAQPNACAIKHIDLGNMVNSSIINTDNQAFNAHSGKYVLGVNPNSTAIRSFAVKGAPVDSFNLAFVPTSKNYGLWVGGITGSRVTQYCGVPYVGQQYVGEFNTNSASWLSVAGYNVECNGYQSGNFFYMHHYYQATTSGNLTIPVTIRGGGVFNLFVFNDSAGYFPPDDDINLSQYMNTPAYLGNGSNPSSFNCAGDPWEQTFTYPVCAGRFYKFVLLYSPWRPDYCSFTQFPSAYGCGIVYANGTNPFPVVYRNIYQQDNYCYFSKPVAAKDSMMNPIFNIPSGKKMVFSAWVREECGNPAGGIPCTISTYANNLVNLQFNDGGNQLVTIKPSGAIIEGWQRYEGYFTAPAGATQMTMNLVNNSSQMIYYDDIRIHPFNANMKTYVYDPVNLRVRAELDPNNYASFYEYDEEGTLIRTKVETKEGVKTITESRSANQKNITTLQ